MENKQRKINLEPLYTFFTEDTKPRVFAELLDEFLFDYLSKVVQLQLLERREELHEHTNEFIFYLKLLRDIMSECEKV